MGGHADPLLDNSNLCDILMLERALESEAALGGGMLTSTLAGQGPGENKVDMLEIPGKGRCYVYLARLVDTSCIFNEHHLFLYGVFIIIKALWQT